MNGATSRFLIASPLVKTGDARAGFALVIALSLMAFVLLLLLSMTALTRVETQAANQTLTAERARQNARLGLMLALGELQRGMGPDQRVNALAERDLPSGDLETSNRRYWTGVLQGWTGPDGETLVGQAAESRPVPVFRRWLVSAADPDGSLPEWIFERDSGLSETLPDPVALVGSGDDFAEVRAGKVGIEEGEAGAYAWWVGDENAKAHVARRAEGEDDLEAWFARRRAGAPDVRLMEGLDGLDPQSDRLARIDDRGTLAFLLPAEGEGGANPDSASHLFHKATPFAFGVAANTRGGGLRRDLSRHLDRTESELRDADEDFAEAFFGGLYTTPGIRNTNQKHGGSGKRGLDTRLHDSAFLDSASIRERIDLGGIHFGELWAYHNLWREIEDERITAGEGYTETAAAPYKAPVMIRGGMLVSVTTKLSEGSGPADSDPRYDIELRMAPVAWIWNPYDVAIEFGGDEHFRATVANAPYQIEFEVLRDGSRQTLEDDDGDAVVNELTWNNSIQEITLKIGENDPLRMDPGEVRIFSATGDADTDFEFGKNADADEVGSRATVEGRPGWNRGAGIRGVGVEEAGGGRGEGSFEEALRGDDKLYARFEYHNPNRGGLGENNSMMSGGRANPRYYTGFYGRMPPDDHTSIGWSTFHSGVLFNVGAFPYGQRPEHRFESREELFPTAPEESGDWLPVNDAPVKDWAGPDGWQDVAFLGTRMATEDNSIEAWPDMPFLRHFNPGAAMYHIDSYEAGNLLAIPFRFEIHGLNSNNDVFNLDIPSGSFGFFGGGYKSGDGSPNVINRSVPRMPPFSIADYQHAAAVGRGARTPEEVQSGFQTTRRVGNHIGPVAGRAIGNSYAPSVLPSDAVRGFFNPAQLEEPVFDDIPGVPAVDHSYLANFHLWDDWFLSSLGPDPVTERSSQEVIEDFKNGEPAPNPRMRFYDSDAFSEEVSQGIGFEPGEGLVERFEDVVSERSAAAGVLIEGAFNVNATDPDVWAAQLAALRGQRFPSSPPGSSAVSWHGGDGLTPAGGLFLPGAGPLDDNDFNAPGGDDQWMGLREQDDGQIRDLAEAVVEEVRERGPFLSIADFVNRRPGDGENARKGALQAALDRTVNPDAGDMGNRWLGANNEAAFPEALDVPEAVGMAGWVHQADILSHLGPFIAARSDTFTIRAYGEVRDPLSEEVEARAWCEAVVQRVPDYVDPSNPPHTPLDDDEAAELGLDPLTETNRQFGRQFRIVSFRWLEGEEI